MTVFNPDVVRRAMNTARIIKPAAGDFILKLRNDGLAIWPWDRRRACLSVATSNSGSESSDSEYLLPEDRSALMDSELDSLSISTNERGMSIKFEGDGQTRSASVRRRADGSKRAKFPDSINSDGFHSFSPKDFDSLLKAVSCSALVKDTKTEEDMRINQVHFYSESNSAVSNARYYASLVRMDGLNIDMSIVSSDIPQMRAFCSKCTNSVLIGQDNSRMYLVDPATGSFISFSRVASTKPPLPSLPEDGYFSSVDVECEAFRKAVKWASMAIEGTQRLTVSVDESKVYFGNGKTELASAPAVLSGPVFSSDFPSKSLLTVAEHIGDGKSKIFFGSDTTPGILEIRPSQSHAIVARHFIREMKR